MTTGMSPKDHCLSKPPSSAVSSPVAPGSVSGTFTAAEHP